MTSGEYIQVCLLLSIYIKVCQTLKTAGIILQILCCEGHFLLESLDTLVKTEVHCIFV